MIAQKTFVKPKTHPGTFALREKLTCYTAKYDYEYICSFPFCAIKVLNLELSIVCCMDPENENSTEVIKKRCNLSSF